MIVERSRALRERLRLADDHEYAQLQADNIRKIQSLMERLQEALDELERHQHVFSAELAEKDNARKILAQIKGSLPASRKSLKNTLILNEALEQLKRQNDRYKQYWRRLAESKYGPFDTLLTILERFEEIRPALVGIRQQTEALKRHAATVPRTTEELRAFLKAIDDVALSFDALPGMNEEVRNFLRNLATGRATLEHVSDRVLAWCRLHPKRFSITIS